MKNIFITFFILSFFLFTPPVNAHMQGVPVVKINDKFTYVYTENENTMIGDTLIPSDIAPDSYLIKKPISFKVETKRLPYPAEVLREATYTWDFGDKQKAKGINVKHTYKKIGTYTVTLSIAYGDLKKFGISEQETPPPPPQQSILVHILPKSSYAIPKALITVNNKDAANGRLIFPFTGKLFGIFPYKKTFTFDASRSRGSGKKFSYYWDFGGGKNSKKAKANHVFKESFTINPVALRITDENNFATDTFFIMENEQGK